MSISKSGDGPSALSFESPSKMGWLHKHGGSGMSSHWKKRWFIVDHHYLFYYKAPNDKKPVGILCLPEYNSCYKAESKDSKKPNSFILDKHSVSISSNGENSSESSDSGASKNYILYADSEEEMESWMHAIQEEIKPMIGVTRNISATSANVKVDPKAFDEVTAIVSEGPKLTHLTTSRPKMKNRRPPRKYAVFHEDDSREDIPESPPDTPTSSKPLPPSPSSFHSSSKKGSRPSVPMVPTKPMIPPTKRSTSELPKDPTGSSPPSVSASKPPPPKKPVHKERPEPKDRPELKDRPEAKEASLVSNGSVISEAVPSSSKQFSKPLPPRKQKKPPDNLEEESQKEKSGEGKPLPTPPPKPKPGHPPKAKPRHSITPSDVLSEPLTPTERAPQLEPPTPTKRPQPPSSSDHPTPNRRSRPSPTPRVPAADASTKEENVKSESEKFTSSCETIELSSSPSSSQSQEPEINGGEDILDKETDSDGIIEDSVTAKLEESSEDGPEGRDIYEVMSAGKEETVVEDVAVEVDDSNSQDLYECMDYNGTTTTTTNNAKNSHSEVVPSEKDKNEEDIITSGSEAYVKMSPPPPRVLNKDVSVDIYEVMNINEIVAEKLNTPDSYEEPEFWKNGSDNPQSSAEFIPKSVSSEFQENNIPIYDVPPSGPPRPAYINSSGTPSTISGSSSLDKVTDPDLRSPQSPEVGRRANSLDSRCSNSSKQSADVSMLARKSSKGTPSLTSSRNNSMSGNTGGGDGSDFTDSCEKKGESNLNALEKSTSSHNSDTVPGTLQQAREILRLAQASRAEAEEIKKEAYRELELARRERHDASLLKKNAAEILKIAKTKL